MAYSKCAPVSSAYDPNERLWERLSALAPGGSSLEPFLRGFRDSGFQAEVQSFVQQRAQDFAVACADGSYPLLWTHYHNEYKQLFEDQLDRVLADLTLSKKEVHDFCEWLKAETDFFEDDPEGFYPFVEAVTASEEFSSFLVVMFAEVQRQQLQQLPPGDAAEPRTQELDITVPEGIQPGQAISVEYLGSRFEIAVPDGYTPGMSFRTAVILPA
eukprot:TRINITY_DN28207_c0_g1_i1.p1 TRINITY_DN28207_c0_g1~~TRINITY_DN28207_c0_g1_i1.p1  ORF type:complete len:227 (+),score=50.54 TRINITY_DN28207_c0_g1_i1:42-683(+)